MRTPFWDGAADVAALVTSFHEAVVQGTVRPYLSEEGGRRVIRLALAKDSAFCLALLQARAGALWVEVEDDSGSRVDSWHEDEVGAPRVRALWALCRSQLYTTDTEEALAALAAWLRTRSHGP